MSEVIRDCASAHALPALDGVRCLAATLVFVVHYHAAFGPLLERHLVWRRLGSYSADVGYHGVSVFFVLSGFLIYGSLVGRRVSYFRFFRRRVERIFPTFLVVLAIYLVLGLLFPSRSKLPEHGVAGYILLNALLVPGVFRIDPIITVAWSLSYEVFFYLGLGLAAAVLRLRLWSRRYRVLLLLALGAAWATAGSVVQGEVRTFIMFLPGLLIYEGWGARTERRAAARTVATSSSASGEELGRPRPAGWWVWATFTGALLSAPAVSSLAIQERLTAVGLAPSVLTFGLLAIGVSVLMWEALTATRRCVATTLSLGGIRFLGTISYSFYLIHGLAINAIAFALGPLVRPFAGAAGPLLYLGLFVPTFAAASLVAFALFNVVERRFSV